MNKNYIYIALICIAVVMVGLSTRESFVTTTPEPITTITSKNCLSDDCLMVDGLEYPVSTLTAEAKLALDKALDDEYKAFSSYQAIIAKLGSSRPFSMIIGAEEQHIASLKALYTKYGVTPIENKYLGKINSPATLTAACLAGVEAEISNAKLYKEELLGLVVAYPDITQVFTNLMDASQLKHLPAFQKCSGR